MYYIPVKSQIVSAKLPESVVAARLGCDHAVIAAVVAMTVQPDAVTLPGLAQLPELELG